MMLVGRKHNFKCLFIYCHKDSEDKGFEGKKDMLRPKTYSMRKKRYVMPQNLLHTHDGHFTL